MVTIINSDEDLRQLLYKHDYVSVKYHNESFKACQELYPFYEMLSNDARYSQITFIRVDATENLIAKKIIEKDVFSFMAIYNKGLLIESQTISTKEDIKTVLEKLVNNINQH